jgi:hypothetical protein
MRNVWGKPVDQALVACGFVGGLATYCAQQLGRLCTSGGTYPRLNQPLHTAFSTTIRDIFPLLSSWLPTVSTAPTRARANFNLFTL